MRLFRVEILIYDGVDELDVVGPYEVFKKAAEIGFAIQVRMVTGEAVPFVIGAHGLRFEADSVASMSSDCDLLIVPGGNWVARAENGAWGEVERGHLFPLLRAYAGSEGRTIASVCTGALLLAHSGIIEKRPITTHPAAMADLKATGANTIESRLVDAGDLVSCGGVTSGIDLALWMLRREFGEELSAAVGGRLDYEAVKAYVAPRSTAE